MSDSSREEKARRRTLPVLVALLTVLVCGSAVLSFFLYAFPEPQRLIDRIELEGTEYLLTCRTKIDGTTEVFLHECEGLGQESCVIVRESSVVGLSCQDVVLRKQNGTIQADLKSGLWTLLTYDPN